MITSCGNRGPTGQPTTARASTRRHTKKKKKKKKKKIYKYKLPSSFNNYFTKRSDVHNYPTRHGNHLNVPQNKKTFSDRSVRTRGPQLWENSLKISKSV